MKNPLISIIVPVYNSEKYVYDCLNSITHQTYLRTEVIIIDDGSTDSSGEICFEFMHQNDNVFYCRTSNRGVSSARNLGMTLAHGDYYVFVDSDDIVSPVYIETFVELIKDSQLGIVGYTTNHSELQKVHRQIDKKTIDAKNLFNSMLSGKPGVDGYLWNKVFDAKIVKENNLIFPENIKIWEDMDFVLRYLKVISSCCESANITYFYRIHEESAVKKITSEKIYSKLIISEGFLQLDQHNKEYTRAAQQIYYKTYLEYCACLAFEHRCTFRHKLSMVFSFAKHHTLFYAILRDFRKFCKIMLS